MLTKLPIQLNWNNRLSFTFRALTEFRKAFQQSKNKPIVSQVNRFIFVLNQPLKKTFKKLFQNHLTKSCAWSYYLDLASRMGHVAKGNLEHTHTPKQQDHLRHFYNLQSKPAKFYIKHTKAR